MVKHYLFTNMSFLSCCFFLVHLNFIKDFFFNTRHINNSATNDDPNWDNPSDTPTSLAIQNWNTLSSVTHNSAIS